MGDRRDEKSGDEGSGQGVVLVIAYLAGLALTVWGMSALSVDGGEGAIAVAVLSLIFGVFAGWWLAIGTPLAMTLVVLFGTMPLTAGSELGVANSFFFAGYLLLLTGVPSFLGALGGAIARAGEQQ